MILTLMLQLPLLFRAAVLPLSSEITDICVANVDICTSSLSCGLLTSLLFPSSSIIKNV
jgi:hypothetical protein